MSVLIVLDILLAVAALFSATFVRFGNIGPLNSVTISTAFIFVIVVLFSSHLMDVYDHSKNIRKREIFINIVFSTITSFSLLSVVYYLVPYITLGRGVLLLSLCFFALYQFCWHSINFVGKNSFHFLQRVLVLGTGSLAVDIGDIITSSKRNLVLAGYASSYGGSMENGIDSDSPAVPEDMIVGTSDDLLETVKRAQADVIVLALSEKRGAFPLRDVLRCKLNGIQVMDAPTLYELLLGKLMLESITPSWFIFSDGFRKSTIYGKFKRAADVILSIIGLLLAFPFFPVLALAIKLDSPGPVFFWQERVGNKEKIFKLYKLRTMRQDAETGTGAVWAEKNDPRVTKLGRFLRGSRIDEIPQLINVLKGDMSLIGPRPERPEFVEKLKLVVPFYSKRHFIKPGITGWAQVRFHYGSSVEDAFEKLRYDLYYIKNTGPFLDMMIFFETIKVILFGFGGR